jgi:hypothetical protein
MEGLVVPFVFKTVYNHYEGEIKYIQGHCCRGKCNVQISKYGGTAVDSWMLFYNFLVHVNYVVYQLGINTVFYIDQHPGISIDQILNAGQNNQKL